MIVHFEYDDRGRPSEARLRVEGGNAFKVQNGPNGEHHVEKIAEGDMLRVRVVYAGDDQALITVYDFDGDIMLQLQSTETSIGSRMQQVLFQWEPQGKPATASSERVDKADDHGNWTLKTLFERDPRTQVDEAVGRLHRTIVYY